MALGTGRGLGLIGSRWSLSGHGWQTQLNTGTAFGVVANAQTAAVLFGDGFGDGQPHAQTVDFGAEKRRADTGQNGR